MKKLLPKNALECRQMILDNGDQITAGDLEIVIHESWINELGLEEQVFLAKNSRNARKTLASSSGTYSPVLELLGGHEDEFVRRRVAGNQTASKDVLARLSSDDSVLVREAVAGNPVSTAELLEKLSLDPGASVRWWVASNDHVPGEILKRLSEDENLHVRYSVAQNLTTSLSVLTRLRSDPEDVVRKKVVYNARFRTSRCFVATACYGSADAEPVMVCRDFRDRVLATSRWGRMLIASYYQVSPPIAGFIGRHPILVTLVRSVVLDPIVRRIRRTNARVKASDQAAL